MTTPTTEPRLTQALATRARRLAQAHPLIETGGIFFFPYDDPRGPAYLALKNRADNPVADFQFDYEDMARPIVAAYGQTAGIISFFHSHPNEPCPPSRIDLELAFEFEARMDGHPLWRPAARHFVFALPDSTWWWHDFDNHGQVGWEFPE